MDIPHIKQGVPGNSSNVAQLAFEAIGDQLQIVAPVSYLFRGRMAIPTLQRGRDRAVSTINSTMESMVS